MLASGRATVCAAPLTYSSERQDRTTRLDLEGAIAGSPLADVETRLPRRTWRAGSVKTGCLEFTHISGQLSACSSNSYQMGSVVGYSVAFRSFLALRAAGLPRVRPQCRVRTGESCPSSPRCSLATQLQQPRAVHLRDRLPLPSRERLRPSDNGAYRVDRDSARDYRIPPDLREGIAATVCDRLYAWNCHGSPSHCNHCVGC